MRKIPIPPCPAHLSGEDSDGVDEEARAVAFFTDNNRDPGASFTFSAYRHESVRTALWLAFEKVCAYCETPIPTPDIEHYRPKARVSTPDGPRTGYYWLASRWDNLLPSCHYCNTRRSITDGDGPKETWGKGSHFPLAHGSRRAERMGEEENEHPLLLHPYRDDPDRHLKFLPDGGVVARSCPDGTLSPEGEETISLLGLNRHGLPKARKKQLSLVKLAEKEAMEARRAWDADPDNQDLEEEFRIAQAEFEERASPADGYSAATRDYLESGARRDVLRL